MRNVIEIITTDEPFQVNADIFKLQRQAWLGIHRMLTSEGEPHLPRRFCVTHIPTGILVGTFFNKKVAVELVKELVKGLKDKHIGLALLSKPEGEGEGIFNLVYTMIFHKGTADLYHWSEAMAEPANLRALATLEKYKEEYALLRDEKCSHSGESGDGQGGGGVASNKE
jgi:hypothetical protein